MASPEDFEVIKQSFDTYEARKAAYIQAVADEKVVLTTKVNAAGFTAEEAEKIAAYINS